MPLIASAFLAYAAGLLAGFSSDPRITAVAAMLSGGAIVYAVLFRKGQLFALSVLLACGIVVAVTEPAKPIHRFTKVVPPPDAAPALARIRTSASRRIDTLFGADASMAKALLIAEQQDLGPEVRQRYADAGLVHMLSISGLHVAIVASAVELLLSALSLGRARAAALSLIIVWVYVAVIGAPAPALRSAVMLSVAAASRIAQRPTSPWASLAIGAAVPLYEPRNVLGLGYQLSVAGMAGLTASASITRRWIAPRIDGWKLAASNQLLPSIIATIVTAPLIAWYFGRLSLVGPVSNVFAAPVIAVLQPMLFLAMLLPLDAAAQFVADGCVPLLRVFDSIAVRASAVPYAALHATPSLMTTILCGAAIAALVAAASARFSARPALVGALTLSVAIWYPLLPPPHRGEIELHMLDVGQGDALALRTTRGNWILFDAGRAWRTGDAGRSVIIPYLARRGGKLAAFVLSHPHNDHAGGASTVLLALKPRSFYDPGFVAPTGTYAEALASAGRVGTRWDRVSPGDSLVVDGLTVDFLAPDSAWASRLTDPNEASAIARVRFGAVRFLLVGDAEKGLEQWLVENDSLNLRADVLKVAHHGSSTSTTQRFLDAAQPRVALISVGKDNSYRHPNAAVVERLARSGAAVYRTDQLGTVVVSTDGRRVRVRARGQQWEIAPR
ncbi:MAG TPA: DNA internalization-related competence protein ComEC/Rec2 [Gemmatimonadaceae bacterium]|nr:DNA internalization-related competence protein ComEC/Rec2 [Gemmatimonadaceae bacterium]